MSVYALDRLLAETRRLAADYRAATGKVLPVSAEIAVHDAIRLLALEPAPPGSAHDAERTRDGVRERVLVKGRVVFDPARGGQRLGQLRLDREWEVLVVVLLDGRYEPTELIEVPRPAVEEVLGADAPSAGRARRGALSVARARIIGERVWSRELGPEGPGPWRNHE